MSYKVSFKLLRNINSDSANISYFTMDESISLQDNPTFIAVSTLSPVNTHTFIPAYLNSCIVSGT